MKSSFAILFISLAFSVISCEKDQADQDNNSKVNLKADIADYLEVSQNPSAETSAPFALNSIDVNGKWVEISVSYSGGCKLHTFDIIWDESILYSHPPKINIIIIHKDNGDLCKAYITEKLSFHLDSLIGDVVTGEVSINGYSGWDAEDSVYYDADELAFNFEESDTCNITVTAKEALCGWGLYDNIWFALEDSVDAGIEGFYYNKYLQPVSIVESLSGFVPESGKKYNIGARIDNTSIVYYPGVVVCLAYSGPSVPVKIMCIEEVE